MWVFVRLLITVSSFEANIQDSSAVTFSPNMLQRPSFHLGTNSGFLNYFGHTRNSYPIHAGKLGYSAKQSLLIRLVMLIMAGDIEANPGPVRSDWPAKSEWGSLYPCGCCELRVDWSDLAVQCDACNVWHHKSCIEMPTCEYNDIENNSWSCYKCKSVNCSSFLYQGYNLNISNSFEMLSGIPGDDSVFSDLQSPSKFNRALPLARSSPTCSTHTRKDHSSSVPSHASTIRSSATQGSCSSNVSHCIKPTDNLRVVIGNINSIKNRKAEITHLCETVQPDIMLFCESKINPEVKCSEFLPPTYAGDIRRDRTYYGGGVIVCYKRELEVTEVEIIQENPTVHHDEIVWAKLNIKNASPVYIAAYYRPSSNYKAGSISFLESSLDFLFSKVIRNNTRSTVFIGGDFNVPDIAWQKQEVSPEGSRMKPLAHNLLNTLNNYELTQLQFEPTWHDSVADLFCTNKPSLIKSVSTVPGFSDHAFIVVDTVLKPVLTRKRPRKIFKWAKANWETIKSKTVEFSNATLNSTSTQNVEQLYTSLCDHVKSLEVHIPTTWSRSRPDVPWLTGNLKRKCRKKQRLYNRAKKNRKTSHWTAYNTHANNTKKDLNSAHWNHLNDVLNVAEKEHNTKPLFKYIKSQQQDSVGIATLMQNGEVHRDAASKASALQDQFKSVFTSDEGCPDKDRTKSGQGYPSISSLQIEEAGVLKLLKNINPSKAGGPDNIAGRLLKELATEFAPFFTHLFNLSLSSGEVPSLWGEQWVNPIFKKGLKSEPANYRPVSLTCITSKLMEHIICSHIRGLLDKPSILSRFQHGFRSGHSCVTQLLLTVYDIATMHDKNKQVDIGILDFSKAFDVVPHQRLLNKLSHYGVDGVIRTWISSFLRGRSQKVVVDGIMSEPADVQSGVTQVTVLGPLLFLLYVNDLPEEVSQGTVIRLFADDCLIYRSINTINDQLILQHDIDRMMIWADQWGMKFNATKCNVMRTLGGIHSERFYTMKNQILKEVSHAKYLGVSLSNDLTWAHHIDQVLLKANQKLGFIRRNLRGAPIRSKSIAYFTMVRSSMEYAAPIWDPYLQKDINALERVQRKAARWATSQYSYTTSVTGLLQNLKWAPLSVRRQHQKLSLFHNIHTGAVKLNFARDFGIEYAQRTTRTGSIFTADGETVSHKLHRPRVPKKPPLRNSTIVSTIPHWNCLPGEVTALSTSDSFRSALSRLP